MTEYFLGRKKDHTPENRVRRAAFTVEPSSVAETKPRSVAWRDARPARIHLDQDCNGCTGWALVNALNHKPHHALRRPTLGDEQGRQRYLRATQLDAWPGEYPLVDEGSSGGAAAAGAVQDGLVREYRWVFDRATFWAALSAGPVYVGTTWYSRMFSPDSEGKIFVAGDDAGGHQYVVDAYDRSSDLFRVNNSWGRAWGKNGCAYVERDAFFDLLFDDGGDAIQLVT